VIAQEDITSVSGQSGWKIERTLEVSEGDTFAVVLYVQTGAGVYWSESFDSSFIAEARPKDYIKDNPPGTVGEYGRMLFTFKAVKKGTATIDFDYLSHTDGDSSRTVEITVHIR
jgi:predicted secreted protein